MPLLLNVYASEAADLTDLPLFVLIHTLRMPFRRGKLRVWDNSTQLQGKIHPVDFSNQALDNHLKDCNPSTP
jgi:hypothetical protein